MADLELKHDVENKKESEFNPSSIKIEDESAPSVETSDRGLFDFMGKKKEEDVKKPGHKEEEAKFATEFDQKVQVSEPEHKEEEKKHESLLQKLQRSDSGSSSSSEEEVEVDGEKIKKKKEKKEKIKEKISGEKKEEVPVEKVHVEGVDPEKKGFLDKMKDKLPCGGEKKPEEIPPPPPPVAEAAATTPTEGEKKGFLEKIKEKLPGYHPKTEEEKEKEKEAHHESH